MIAKGSRLQFEVRGSVGEWLPRTVDDVRQQAINSMSAYVTVESCSLLRTDNAFWREYWDWGYTAQVTVRTRSDHNALEDVTAIVSSAFQTASGEIPTVTPPGQQGSECQPGGTCEPSNKIGFALFGLAAIAVAVFVAKRG